MEPSRSRPRRPARAGRWVASGLTAAVAIGSVGAMADAAEEEIEDVTGSAAGATAAWRAEIAVAELMAAADAGDETSLSADDPIARPPRIGRAGAS
ncbi:MAG: hypothetical protein AAF548_03865 [Actinomycetota bacterium]